MSGLRPTAFQAVLFSVAEGRVVAVERFAEIFPVQMSINLGCGDAFMTQHLLDCAQIGSAFDKMGGEGMPEGMGRDILGYTGQVGQVADDVEDHHPGEPASAPVKEQDI